MKKFIYLISPPKLNDIFFEEIEEILSSKKIKFFQLRLKNASTKKIIYSFKKIKQITNKKKVKLILNDDMRLAEFLKADGCHLGQKDGSIKMARKKLKRKLIGVTCHNSRKLCISAEREGVNYIALGSFFKSKLKPKAIKANMKILKWAKKNIKVPIVAIGGIDNRNYKKIIKAGANYIALSSFIWNNPNLKPQDAIKKF